MAGIKTSADYQYYYYKVNGEDFSGRKETYGKQNALSIRLKTSYGFSNRFEIFQTKATSWFNVAEYVPRLTPGYGSSQGRVDYWFDAASIDFNKDG